MCSRLRTLSEPWISCSAAHLLANPWRTGVLMNPESKEVFDSDRLLSFGESKLGEMLKSGAGATERLPRCFFVERSAHSGAAAAPSWPAKKLGICPVEDGAELHESVAEQDRLGGGLVSALGGHEHAAELADFVVILIDSMLFHRRPNGKEHLERRATKGQKDEGDD